MTWLAQNWIWVLFGVAFVAMHLFGHGGHGGHGGHSGHGGHGLERGRSVDSNFARDGRSDPLRPARPGDASRSHHH